MASTIIGIHAKGSSDFHHKEKSAPDYTNELREVINLVESAKTRLGKMTLDMDADNVEIGALDEALDAIDDAIDLMEDALEDIEIDNNNA